MDRVRLAIQFFDFFSVGTSSSLLISNVSIVGRDGFGIACVAFRFNLLCALLLLLLLSGLFDADRAFADDDDDAVAAATDVDEYDSDCSVNPPCRLVAFRCNELLPLLSARLSSATRFLFRRCEL